MFLNLQKTVKTLSNSFFMKKKSHKKLIANNPGQWTDVKNVQSII